MPSQPSNCRLRGELDASTIFGRIALILSHLPGRKTGRVELPQARRGAKRKPRAHVGPRKIMESCQQGQRSDAPAVLCQEAG